MIRTASSHLLFLFFFSYFTSHASTQLLHVYDDNSIRVAWSAALQAWDVRFVSPRKAALVIPQLCPASQQCSARASDGIFSCSELRYLLQQGNWHNYNLAFAPDQCLQKLSPMPATDSAWQQAVGAYSSTLDVHVVWPLAVRIYHHLNSSTLTPYVKPHDSSISMRLLFITRFINSPVMAVHVESFTIPLRLPQNTMLSATFQHECSRRGLQAPLLSTMDLFVNARGDQVCVWDCRYDCFRVPWNSAPPLLANMQLVWQALPSYAINSSNSSNSSVATHSHINATASTSLSNTHTERICQALPSVFTAVEFDFTLQVDGVTSPQLLDDAFLTQLDQAADRMSLEATNKNKRESTIMLSIRHTAYNYIQFDNFILRAVSSRRKTDLYTITENALYVPNSPDEDPETASAGPLSRRLLQENTASSFVVYGICIIASTTLPGTTVESNLRSTLLALPVSAFHTDARDKYGLQIIRIHTLPPEPQTQTPSPSAQIIHSTASALSDTAFSSILFVIAGILICCCGAAATAGNNNHKK